MSPTPADAQTVFLGILEASPDDPIAALDALALDPALRGRIEGMVAAYLRTRALEAELVATDGEIARAMAEVERDHRGSVDRRIPARIRGYRIERVLGEGPHAAVLLAEQQSPIERAVAIKLLFADASDPRVAARAELERQILASLEHPNIARIYDFGVDEAGRPYIVMEYVRGGQVEEWCRGRVQGEREVVRDIFLGIASAVRFAHAHGVLHCDLKCANVLVQVIEGVPHAKVIDFGIARAIGGALAQRAGLAELPRTIGTLASMSPEALDPASPQLDVRSDVYGLGLILLELLAGRPARQFADGDLATALRRLISEPLPRLRALVPDASPDIDAIVAKATASCPAERYQGVGELVADLERFLAGREVAARPRTAVERSGALLRRYWKIAAIVLAVLIPAGVWTERASRRESARLERLVDEARSTLDAARALRNTAGRGNEREDLVARALGATRAAEVLKPESTEVARLRADAVEEAILPRLLRGEHKSRETVALVDELVALRERIADATEDAPSALERLSVALAYQIDTVWGTPAYEALEVRQLVLDEHLFESYPDSRVYADNLCWTYQRVLDPVFVRGDRDRAMDYLRRSASIGEQTLVRHGRSPATLHTALAAAWYESLERTIAGDRAGCLRALERARMHGQELLALSPDHARGAFMFVRAAVDEAVILLDGGDAAGAARVSSVAREIAAEVERAERGTGFLRTPLGDGLLVEARSALLLGDLEGAERACAALSDEIDREPAALAQPTRAEYERYAAARDFLRARIALARGDAAAAVGQLALLLASIERFGASSEAGRLSIEGIADQAGDMRRSAVGSTEFDALVADLVLLARKGEVDSSFVDIRRLSRARLEAVHGDVSGARRLLEEVVATDGSASGTVSEARRSIWMLDALPSGARPH